MYKPKPQKCNSPDISPHKNNPTRAPIDQIKQYRKMEKKVSRHRNQQLEYIWMLEGKVERLQKELQEHKQYVKEFESLVVRNQRLEEQMMILLNQIESRKETIQIGNPESIQVAELHDRVIALDSTISNVLEQYQQLQQDIKTASKQDMNSLEQRLMNYIFGLEDKIAQLSSSTHKIANSLKEQQQAKVSSPHSSSSPSSLISLMNLQVTSQIPQTVKKQPKRYCENCEKLREQINSLEKKHMEQFEECDRNFTRDKLVEEMQNIQSNIEIVLESSVEEFDDSKQGSSHSLHTFETKVFLEQIRKKIMGLMAQLKRVTQACLCNDRVTKLEKQNFEKQEKITELEGQLRQLRFSMREKENSIQNLEKLLRMQINQHDGQRTQPKKAKISCVNHEETKQKLKKILNSIRNLQSDWESKFAHQY